MSLDESLHGPSRLLLYKDNEFAGQYCYYLEVPRLFCCTGSKYSCEIDKVSARNAFLSTLNVIFSKKSPTAFITHEPRWPNRPPAEPDTSVDPQT